VVYVGGQDADQAPYTSLYAIKATSQTPLFGDTTFGTYPHPDSRSLTFLDSNHLVETDDGGIYALSYPALTADGFVLSGWASLNGDLQDTEFYSVAYDTVHGVIVGGAQDNGTEVQAFPENSVWQPLPGGGGDGGQVGIDAAGSRNYFAHGSFLRDGQTVRLNDPFVQDPFGVVRCNGLNSADQATLNNDAGHTDEFFPFALSPAQGERLLYGMTGVYESFDGGDTVTDVTPPTPRAT
jgi:hypothetical protein